MSGQEGLGRHGRAGRRAYIASRDGREALGSARLGEAFINEMFDRFILAVAERLSTHIARGNMRDVRMAALALASQCYWLRFTRRSCRVKRFLRSRAMPSWTT
jgi:hypothetical protein